MLILGFSGTVLGPRPAQHRSMRDFLARLRPDRLVHGGARGCDTLAHTAFRTLFPDRWIEIHPGPDPGVTVTLPIDSRYELYPALDNLDRNRVIVSRIHGLLAVPRTDVEELGSGTWATVRYARDLGCPVYIVLADGTIVRDVDPVFAI